LARAVAFEQNKPGAISRQNLRLGPGKTIAPNQRLARDAAATQAYIVFFLGAGW
jgi:hypothetical protein